MNNSQNSQGNTLFYRTSLVAPAPEGFRFPPCNFIIKRLQQKCFSVNFEKLILKVVFTFDRTPPDDCFLYLSVNFEFFGTLLLYSTSGKLLFSVQVEEFQPPYTVKNYFTGPFKRPSEN